MKKFNYRNDLNALRGLAVSAVVLYHSFPQIFKGGFSGVDVFFVLSGYLITLGIDNSLSKNDFSLKNFYFRRINRIFPALLLVLSASLIIAYNLFLKGEFVEFGRQLTSAGTFTSNFLLANQAGYFDNARELKPLMHLWSLAIEEQFYIFWPLLLVLISGFGKHRKNFKPMALALIVISLASCFYFAPQNPIFAFYSPLTRAWELVAGACLVYFSLQFNTIFFYLGLALILGSSFILPNEVPRQSLWLLFPVLGSLFFIGSNKQSSFSRHFCDNPVLNFLGDISYPLYLWHWTLYSFGQYLTLGISNTSFLISTLFLSLILAALTAFLLEKPLRFGFLSQNSYKKISGYFIILFVILSCGLLIQTSRLLPLSASLPVPEFSSVTLSLDTVPSEFASSTYNNTTILTAPGGRAGKTLYYGDSNIKQYLPRLNSLLIDRKAVAHTAVVIASGGCLPLISSGPGTAPLNPDCQKTLESAVLFAKSDEVDTIVIGALWPLYVRTSVPQLFYEELTKTLKLFVSSKKNIYILLSTPLLSTTETVRQIKRTFFPPDFSYNLTGFSKEQRIKNNSVIYDTVLKVSRELPGVKVIDPLDFLCHQDTCPYFSDENIPLYPDGRHLNPAYVVERAVFIDQTLIGH